MYTEASRKISQYLTYGEKIFCTYGRTAGIIAAILRYHLDLNLKNQKKIFDGRVWANIRKVDFSRETKRFGGADAVDFALRDLSDGGEILITKYRNANYYSLNIPRYKVPGDVHEDRAGVSSIVVPPGK